MNERFTYLLSLFLVVPYTLLRAQSSDTKAFNSLVEESYFQKELLIAAGIVLLLAIAGIFFLRRNLTKTRELHDLVSKRNTQLHRALLALEDSQADNTKLMSMVVHDLRGPMGGMITAIDILRRNNHLDESEKDMLQLMDKSCHHSLELIGEMLQVQGTLNKMTFEDVDLKAMLLYCKDITRSKALHKQQEIQLDVSPVIIQGNREKLWRTVNNLVTNAIKFSGKGTRIELGLKLLESKVQIFVKDQGIGIPEDFKENLFQLYTNARRLGTEGEPTFGLGLAISKQIVEAHNGKIWCENNPDAGTTFYIELPR